MIAKTNRSKSFRRPKQTNILPMLPITAMMAKTKHTETRKLIFYYMRPPQKSKNQPWKTDECKKLVQKINFHSLFAFANSCGSFLFLQLSVFDYASWTNTKIQSVLSSKILKLAPIELFCNGHYRALHFQAAMTVWREIAVICYTQSLWTYFLLPRANLC